MEKLSVLVLAMVISAYSYSQIITLHFFQYYAVEKSELDTTSSEIYDVNLTYVFDFTNNTVSAVVNGSYIQEEITVYSTNDSVITLVYTKNASAGWILDFKTKRVNYFAFNSKSEKELEIINPILIVAELPKKR